MYKFYPLFIKCIQQNSSPGAAANLSFHFLSLHRPVSVKNYISHPPPLISTNSDRVIADVNPGLDWSRSWFHPWRTEPEAQFVLHGGSYLLP
ncbi:hypothetical protein CEXT_796891 [Caerostris extrusa]|uniref:Uncharacterized protein n=1 Tax=Caerostris extrusa TaxID=172846 RepID=A0AAV4XDB1_CAEEX|nr:hypothetical protein CEXT_796891 [Caerostris extrusa]